MNKKLLVTLSVLFASSTLVLAGCKGGNGGGGQSTGSSSDPAPSVDPISDIEVTRPEGEIVVGDIIDLDSCVNVVGGSNPKGYDVTVRPASAEVVSLEGHVLTVLKEGPISLKLEAGDESVLVDWEAYSAIKASFKSFQEKAAAEYSFRDVQVSSAGAISYAGTGNIHNENYYYSYGYDSTAKANVGEGMIRLGDGKMYDFTADDLEGTNFAVTPGGEAATYWEYYFVNMGFSLDYSCFETVVDDDGYTSLVCDASVAAPSGMEDYAANMPAYMLLCSYGYRMSATAVKMDTMKVVLEELASGIFLFELWFEYTDAIINTYGDNYAGEQLGELALIGDAEDAHLAPADAYLEAGTIPEALTFTELNDRFGAMDTAKNYTVDVKSGWFDQPSVDGNAVTSPLASYGDAYVAAVPASEYSNKVLETSYADEAKAIVDSLATLEVSGKEVADDGAITFGISGEGAEAYITAVFAAAGSTGTTLNSTVPQLWPSYGVTMFDGYTTVTADSVVVDLGFTWSTGTYYRIQITFSAVGSTVLGE